MQEAKINLKKVRPMFTKLITTMDEYKPKKIVNETDIINSKEAQHVVKEIQRVIEVGDSVRNIKPGDYVMISSDRYAVRKHAPGSIADQTVKYNPITAYNWPVITLEGKDRLLLEDRDIILIVDEFTEE